MSTAISISVDHHSYPIWIGSGLMKDSSLIHQYIRSQQVLIVSNNTIAPLYLERLLDSLKPYQCDVVLLNDGEQYKNQQSLNSIYDTLIEKHHHRDTTLIALGGGVVGDICGFAAATYQRGVRFIQVPTSLLAQVDASVGGKTAINHPKGKNMIGCFHQPHAVIIDTDTLMTLEQREYLAGLGEVIKYAYIDGQDTYSLIETYVYSDTSTQQSSIAEIIERCCQIKADIVNKDEKETGVRALLNFGHTFAHALETVTHYTRWLHGEAVAIGMVCALTLSNQLNLCDVRWLNQLIEMLKKLGLPYTLPSDINVDDVLEAMWSDKKVSNNRLRFILCRKPGDCFIEDNISQKDIHQALKAAMGDSNE